MTERATVRGLRVGRTRSRVVAVIAIGALAMGALTACRSDAGSPAFVGDTRISVAEVCEGDRSGTHERSVARRPRGAFVQLLRYGRHASGSARAARRFAQYVAGLDADVTAVLGTKLSSIS